MKCAICMAAAIGVASLGGWALAAEDENADQQKSKNLESLCQAVRELVLKYYPQAAVTSSYDQEERYGQYPFPVQHPDFHDAVSRQAGRMASARGSPRSLRGGHLGRHVVVEGSLRRRHRRRGTGIHGGRTRLLQPADRPVFQKAGPPSPGHLAVSGRNAALSS